MEIIGPDGSKYYSEDHFASTSTNKSHSNIPKSLNGIRNYIILIAAIVAVIRGLILLVEIALGLLLLFFGRTGIQYFLIKKK